MHVIAADGTRIHPLWRDVDVRGTASWSPDGKWIVAAGSDRDGAGLFKLPDDGGWPVRIATGSFQDPVWSPRGDLIVYGGTQVFTVMPLLAMHPDGTLAKLPEINVQRDGERARFLPNGEGLVYMLGSTNGGAGLLAARPQHDALTAFDPAVQSRRNAGTFISSWQPDCIRPFTRKFGDPAY